MLHKKKFSSNFLSWEKLKFVWVNKLKNYPVSVKISKFDQASARQKILVLQNLFPELLTNSQANILAVRKLSKAVFDL